MLMFLLYRNDPRRWTFNNRIYKCFGTEMLRIISEYERNYIGIVDIMQ
jgi:hypothetical protein